MSQKPRIPASVRRQDERFPGAILRLTKSLANSERKRKRDQDKWEVAAQVRTWRRLGLIQAADHSAPVVASASDGVAENVIPIHLLVRLYNEIRTDVDRDRWISEASLSLKIHRCPGNRCLCGRVQRLLSTLVDSVAVENGVTAWLPDPRHLVPGSACGNER